MKLWKRTPQEPDPAATAVSVVSGASVLAALSFATWRSYPLPATVLLALAGASALIGLLGILSPTLMRWRSSRPGWALLALAGLAGIVAFVLLG